MPGSRTQSPASASRGPPMPRRQGRTAGGSRSWSGNSTARTRLWPKRPPCNPARWSRQTRNWTPVAAVTLNSERNALVQAALPQTKLSSWIGEPAFPSRPGKAKATARSGGAWASNRIIGRSLRIPGGNLLDTHRHAEIAHGQQGPSARSEFAKSKTNTMNPEIARDQNYDDHHADDSKDVHFVLPPHHDMTTPGALSLQNIIVIATACSPSIRPLRRSERARVL